MPHNPAMIGSQRGSERPPGQATETRRMVETARGEPKAGMGNRSFVFGLVVIAIAILVFALLR